MDPSPTAAPPASGDKWALYSAALSGRRQDYYLRHFRRIDAGKALGLSWNWAAMFFTFSWLRYRRMYAFSWAYFFVSTPVLFFMLLLFQADICAAALTGNRFTPQQVFLILLLLGYLLPPLFANRLYFRFVKKKIAAAQGRETDENALGQLLHKSASTAGYGGSAMLMVGVVIVIAVAVPSYADYTTRAKISELILAGSMYRLQTNEFFAANKRLPAKIGEIGGFSGPAGKVKSIMLEKDGTIRIVAGFEPLDGRSILFIPSVRDDKLVWSCRSDDIPNTCLPAECRK